MPRRGRVTGHVVGIEKIRLAAAGTSHPLPTEVVAGEIAIQQMPIQPIGGDAPMHLAHMHHVARQPHARMVVQKTGGVQRTHRFVHHRHTGASRADIGRQLAGVKRFGYGARMQ